MPTNSQVGSSRSTADCEHFGTGPMQDGNGLRRILLSCGRGKRFFTANAYAHEPGALNNW